MSENFFSNLAGWLKGAALHLLSEPAACTAVRQENLVFSFFAVFSAREQNATGKG